LLLHSPLSAEQRVIRGPYEIHYTAISSTLIPASVAAKHGLVRSGNRIITNIAIRTSDKSVGATITGTAENILNQLQPLDFHEVIEQGTIYYLAEQIINEKDLIRYNIQIQPVGSQETYELAFQRQYF
jgi:hypothetical protein